MEILYGLFLIDTSKWYTAIKIIEITEDIEKNLNNKVFLFFSYNIIRENIIIDKHDIANNVLTHCKLIDQIKSKKIKIIKRYFVIGIFLK